MTIHERVMYDRENMSSNRGSLSFIAGQICVDGKAMNDSDAIMKLSQIRKACEKSLPLYNKEDTYDRFLEEQDFIKLISVYIPQGATALDVEKAIKSLNVESDMRSMGKVMGYLKGKFPIVDGNLVKSVLLGK